MFSVVQYSSSNANFFVVAGPSQFTVRPGFVLQFMRAQGLLFTLTFYRV